MNKFTTLTDAVDLVVTVALSWIIFSVANSNFQTIVLAGLVLIYANVVFERSMSAVTSSRHVFFLTSLFHKFHTQDEELDQSVKVLSESGKQDKYTVAIAVAKFILLELISFWKVVTVLIG